MSSSGPCATATPTDTLTAGTPSLGRSSPRTAARIRRPPPRPPGQDSGAAPRTPRRRTGPGRRLAHRRHDRRSHAAQDRIARRVPVLVVQRLELVDVDHRGSRRRRRRVDRAPATRRTRRNSAGLGRPVSEFAAARTSASRCDTARESAADASTAAPFRSAASTPATSRPRGVRPRSRRRRSRPRIGAPPRITSPGARRRCAPDARSGRRSRRRAGRPRMSSSRSPIASGVEWVGMLGAEADEVAASADSDFASDDDDVVCASSPHPAPRRSHRRWHRVTPNATARFQDPGERLGLAASSGVELADRRTVDYGRGTGHDHDDEKRPIGDRRPGATAPTSTSAERRRNAPKKGPPGPADPGIRRIHRARAARGGSAHVGNTGWAASDGRRPAGAPGTDG